MPTNPDRPKTPTRSSGRAALAMDPEEFRRIGHELVDRIADFLPSRSDRPVTPGETPEAVRGFINAEATLPEAGGEASEVLRSTAELLFDHSLLNAHPRFFGYITSSPAPIGMLGDFLAAAVNPNVGAWTLSPIATEIEAQAVRWIAELIGYPTDCGGLFVTGGNVANFVGFLAGRTAKAEGDIASMGTRAGRPLRVYASAETHTWIQKAADLFGLGTSAIRWIETDPSLRMDVTCLRAAVERDRAAGDLPMLVVGTAGTVSTGAVDPLAEIAEVCQETGAWFHVDGAYGALAATVPGTPESLRSLHLADSLAVDPHKWLYAPLEAGCVLVRDPEALRNTFSYHPPYYHFGTEVINYVDLGLQNSRGFRALKVWLSLRLAGRTGYVESIGEDIHLNERLHAAVVANEELEALTSSLSITTFRYVPMEMRASVGERASEEYLSALNEELLDRIQRSGEAFVSNAVVGGRYVLRTCIVNLNTRKEDVDALPAIVVRHGRQVHDLMRPPR